MEENGKGRVEGERKEAAVTRHSSLGRDKERKEGGREVEEIGTKGRSRELQGDGEPAGEQVQQAGAWKWQEIFPALLG